MPIVMTRFELECRMRKHQEMLEKRARLTLQCIELLERFVERSSVINKRELARALGVDKHRIYGVIRATPAIARIIHQHARLVGKKNASQRVRVSPPLVPRRAAQPAPEPA